MKTKRMLAALLALCIGLGCIGVTAFADAVDTIALDEIKTVIVPASDDFVDEYVYYNFTPDEDGTYALWVDSDAIGYLGNIFVYTDDESLDTYYYETGLLFSAEAGQACELVFNYYGEYYEDVEYAVSLVKCDPMEALYLEVDTYEAVAGDFTVMGVCAEPLFFELEPIEWVSSNSAVVEIGELYSNGLAADLYFVTSGTATVTATTESGLTASMEVIVGEAPEAVPLELGENVVTVPYEGLEISFTPEVTGYYTVTVIDEELGYCYFYEAENVSDGEVEYYSMEADVTYLGCLSSWAEEPTELTVIIEYCEDVEIPEPVAISINKLPDNTVFLSGAVAELMEEQVLGGLELTVTWSDGSESVWSYDEEGNQIGNTWLGYELVSDDETGETQVVAYVSGTEIPEIFWELTILDLEVESITLVDDSPLQIVENSCGIDIGTLVGEDIMDGWYYLPFSAYVREVVITFNDGSTVNAYPGETVYGVEVYCEDSQFEAPWTKDGENTVVYSYSDAQTVLAVEIVDSPVERIELITMPDTTFVMTEDNEMMNANGEIVESFRQFLAGLSLSVYYKDGTEKTFLEEDIQWVEIMGEEYPFLDGYPLGVVEGLLSFALDEDFGVPCEIETNVEYMGAVAPYTIRFVEEFDAPVEEDKEQDNQEQIPETGDMDMFVSVAAVVITLLCGTVLITEKKKLF